MLYDTFISDIDNNLLAHSASFPLKNNSYCLFFSRYRTTVCLIACRSTNFLYIYLQDNIAKQNRNWLDIDNNHVIHIVINTTLSLLHIYVCVGKQLYLTIHFIYLYVYHVIKIDDVFWVYKIYTPPTNYVVLDGMRNETFNISQLFIFICAIKCHSLGVCVCL